MSDKTDLVDPHEGQGIPVNCLNIQTPSSPPPEALRLYVIASQIYPARQADDKRAYNLFLIIWFITDIAEFSAYFFLWWHPES